MSVRRLVLSVCILPAFAFGCSSDDGTSDSSGATGGVSSTAIVGGTTTSTGVISGTGGATGTGVISTTGGAVATGGSSSTGVISTTGGAAATGGSSSTGGSSAATGGSSASTGDAASCTDNTWDPPDSASGANGVTNTGIPAGLDKEWTRSGADILAATNIKIRQMMENGGKMRYCARWDSTSAISKTERQQVAALMAKADQQWVDQLAGWGCWPYSTVDSKVVMWVVTDASLLTDWDSSEGSYVIGTQSSDDSDMACPSACLQLPANSQMSSCSGGEVYDEFLWLDAGLSDYTGWGYSEGFYMSANYFMSAATSNADTETIVVHELGHAHGLNDFYTSDVVPTGWTSFVMMAGSSTVVTETDGWMLRNVWRHIRTDWGYPAMN